MTDESKSTNFETGAESQAGGSKPRVAKTMLEQDLPQAQKPRVAKTMLEADLPSANSGLNSQARRKVAKTLIDRSVTEEKVLQAAAMQEELAKSPRIAKTLIEHSLQDYYEDNSQNFNQQPQPDQTSGQTSTQYGNQYDVSSSSTAGAQEQALAPRRRPSQSFVAKTMLDHSLLFDALAKSSAKKEQKAAELAAEKALEPVVPFVGITKFKKASPCSWVWQETDSKERFRYCGQCQASVYNFEGLELPEAQALIFKRENRENAPLFKRADGKFMTTDCPVAAKATRNKISIAVVVIAVAATLAAVVALTPPAPPPAPPPSQSESPMPAIPATIMPGPNGAKPSQSSQIQQAPGQSSQGTTPPANGRQLDGSFHWDDSQTNSPASSTTTTPASSTTSAPTEAEEHGDMWEYSSGKGNVPPGK